MTVKDIMTLLESPDRVRVIKDGEEIYNQYFANMEVDKDIVAQIGDAEVKRFRAIPEITHRKYKEEICSCVYTTQSRYSGEVRT